MQQLETDLHNAAALGQQLLQRHDHHVHEMELQRRTLEQELERQSHFVDLVDRLEDTNRHLEDQNLITMRENAMLLRRLEDLRSSLVSADYHNEELRSDLVATENNVGVLSHKAAKARDLESQIVTLKAERDLLEQELLALNVDNGRSNLRFREAESQIAVLHAQLHQLRAEVGEQKIYLDPHPVARCATSSSAQVIVAMPDPEVFTLFASNTTLEEDTADLRRVLADSQDEIRQLREQLHALRTSDEPEHNGPRKTMSQELHQHHHYHYHVPAKPNERKNKIRNSTGARRQSQANLGTPLAFSTPPTKFVYGHERSMSADTLTCGAESSIAKDKCHDEKNKSHHRDSGYFSFASSNDAERTSTEFNSSWQGHTAEDSLAPATRRYRSASCKSILVPQLSHAFSDEEDIAANDRLPLRQSKSHESVKDQGPNTKALHKSPFLYNTPRRPYASPLQQTTTGATVSMTSAELYNPQRNSFTSESLNSLRSMRNVSGPKYSGFSPKGPSIGAAKAIFWRNHSEKREPSVSRPSKWSFANWVSSTAIAPQQSESDTVTNKIVEVSVIDENLLSDALGL